jgi:hypothetical protein
MTDMNQREEMESLIARMDDLGFREAGIALFPKARTTLTEMGYPQVFLDWLELGASTFDLEGELRIWDTEAVMEACIGKTKNYYAMLMAQKYLPFGSDVSGNVWVFDLARDCVRLLDHDAYIPIEDMFDDYYWDDLQQGRLDESDIYLPDEAGYNPGSKYVRAYLENEGVFDDDEEAPDFLAVVQREFAQALEPDPFM